MSVTYISSLHMHSHTSSSLSTVLYDKKIHGVSDEEKKLFRKNNNAIKSGINLSGPLGFVHFRHSSIQTVAFR